MIDIFLKVATVGYIFLFGCFMAFLLYIAYCYIEELENALKKRDYSSIFINLVTAVACISLFYLIVGLLLTLLYGGD